MEIKGIITAMVTPFDENQKINETAARQLVDKLISQGVHGLFILGTNGEFHVLSDDEKVEFAKIVIDQAAIVYPFMSVPVHAELRKQLNWHSGWKLSVLMRYP